MKVTICKGLAASTVPPLPGESREKMLLDLSEVGAQRLPASKLTYLQMPLEQMAFLYPLLKTFFSFMIVRLLFHLLLLKSSVPNSSIIANTV